MRPTARLRSPAFVACLALGLALLAGSSLPAAPKAPTSRTFRMGFTPFPYDMTAKAILDVETFARQNGDILAVRLEGVPWSEAGLQKPFHKKMLNDWKHQKAIRPDGGKLFLALTPINEGHNDLAAYRRENKNQPMPDAFIGKQFDSPLVMEAYLRYCRRAVKFFQPDYLAIGVEVDELFHKAPKKWPPYARLHRHVYEQLKREHPKLPIFASFTLHNMLNAGRKDRRAMLAGFKRLMPYNDIVGVTFYPFLADLMGKTDQSLGWLARQFGTYKKPYAITRTCFPAEPIELKSLKVKLPGSPRIQQRFLAKVLGFSHGRGVAFVVWFVPRDFDRFWEKVRNTAPEFLKVFRDCGLLDEEGKTRPAGLLWEKVRKLPFRGKIGVSP